MEEKAHFKHEANINLSKETPTSDDGDYTILRMSNLQPMTTRWRNKDNGQEGVSLLYLDFYEEIVYDQNFKNINDKKLGQAVLDVLKQKKTNALNPSLPIGTMNNVFNTKKQAEEGRPNARELQFQSQRTGKQSSEFET